MNFKEVTTPFSYFSGVYNYGINADGGSYLFRVTVDDCTLEFAYRLAGTDHFFCGFAENNEFCLYIEQDDEDAADFTLDAPELTLDGAEELAKKLIAIGKMDDIIAEMQKLGAVGGLMG